MKTNVQADLGSDLFVGERLVLRLHVHFSRVPAVTVDGDQYDCAYPKRHRYSQRSPESLRKKSTHNFELEPCKHKRARGLAFSYLPTTNTRDDEKKGKRDQSEGDQQADLQQILGNRSFVLSVESRSWLQTEGIPHSTRSPPPDRNGQAHGRVEAEAALVYWYSKVPRAGR